MSRCSPLRPAALALLLAASLMAAGCGSSKEQAAPAAGGTPPSGASIVPASALAFVSLNTDMGSDQWQKAGALLDRFPGKDKVVRSLLESAFESNGVSWEADVKPALGPEVDVVVLPPPSAGQDPVVVGLIQPADRAKLEQLAKKGSSPPVLGEAGGWTVIADKQSGLEAFTGARGGSSLADSDSFKTAMAGLPAESLVSGYVDVGAILKLAAATGQDLSGFEQATALVGKPGPVSFAVSARDDGILAVGTFALQGGPKTANYAAKLPSEVPADAIAYVSFSNLTGALETALDALGKSQPSLDQQLAQAESFLGLSVRDDLLPLFSQEGALVVAPGTPIPAVSLVLQVGDEQKALAVVDKLAGLAGGFGGGLPSSAEVAGVQAKELSVGPVSLYYAAFDGKLVVTSASQGISGLRDTGAKLADAPGFRAAAEAAGMPEETAGFAYVDLKSAVRLGEDYARLAGTTIPPDVSANLEPLRSLLYYGRYEDGLIRLSGFLGIE